MPKKQHKPHRHRDKHPSRPRHQRKLRRERNVSQNPLEPIQEVSKEKIRLDKNACGDFLDPSLLKTGNEDDILRSKTSRDKETKVKRIFENSGFSKEKSVRHHSLEKDENNILKKLFFRREKSFNDSVQKVSPLKDELPNEEKGKNEKKRKPHNEKYGKYLEEESKKQKELFEKSSTSAKQLNESLFEISHRTAIKPSSDLVVDNGKHEKPRRRKHRSKEQNREVDLDIRKINTVQEVIFCQMNQIPLFQMRSEKKASQIKDSSGRLKRERSMDMDRTLKQRSHLSQRNKNISEESKTQRIKHEKSKERHKKHENAKHGHHGEGIDSFQNQIHNKHKEKHLHRRDHSPSPHIRNNSDARNRGKHTDLSEISLGPYENYFTVERHRHHCRKIPSKTEVYPNQDSVQRYEKRSETNGNKKKSANVEEKIHKIVEGDIKTYFGKIQTLIDKKLDAFLQMNSKEEHGKEEGRKSRQRSKSKTEERTVDDKKKKEERKKSKSRDKKKRENVTREEIINEVLKRLKEENIWNNDPSKPKKYDVSTDVVADIETNDKKHSGKSTDSETPKETCHICKQYEKMRKSERTHNSDNKKTQDHSDKTTHHTSSGKHSESTQDRGSGKSHEHKPKDGHHPVPSSRRSEKDPENKLLVKHKHSSKRLQVTVLQDLSSVTRKDTPKTKILYRSPRKHVSPRDLVLTKPYTSISSQDMHLKDLIADSSFPKHNETLHLYRYNRYLLSASEETMRDRVYEGKRKSLSPERYIESATTSKRNKSNEKPQKKEKRNVEHPYLKYLSSSPRYHSKHGICEQDPFLDKIYLPPENFRGPARLLYNRPEEPCPPQKHDFKVQGIEPPILDSTSTSRKPKKVRKLECKTVSIIGIAPKIELKPLPVMNQTQTSSKSQKSSLAESDFVEKRKKSKRFKLYYKYSVCGGAQENNDLSDARSVISDSFKVACDPSEEETCHRQQRRDFKYRLDADSPQNIPLFPTKKNRPATGEFLLKNITEESSNISCKEYYCRVLSSSHSEYCFKVGKKRDDSKNSFHSRGTWNNRYFRYDVQSRSEFKRSKTNLNSMIMSNSDVILDRYKEKPIKTIFLAGGRNFLENENTKQNHASPVKTILKEKEVQMTFSKECQTFQKETEFVNTLVEDTKKTLEHKGKQFRGIYKTIDILQETIRNSLPKTVDTAVSPVLIHRAEKKKSKYKENVEDRLVQTSREESVEKMDAAIGSPLRSRQSERIKEIVAAKRFQDTAVGESNMALAIKARTSVSKIRQQDQDIHLQSTGVSPIRITEKSLAEVSKSLPRKSITSRTPRPRSIVTTAPVQRKKTTIDSSPNRSVEHKDVDKTPVLASGQKKITERIHSKSPAKPKIPSTSRERCQRTSGPKEVDKAPERVHDSSPKRKIAGKVTEPRSTMASNQKKVENEATTAENTESNKSQPQETVPIKTVFAKSPVRTGKPPEEPERQKTTSAKQADTIKDAGSPSSFVKVLRSEVRSPDLVASPNESGKATLQSAPNAKVETQTSFKKCHMKESRPIITVAYPKCNNKVREEKTPKTSVSKTFHDNSHDACFHYAAPRKTRVSTPSSTNKGVIVNTATYSCQSPAQQKIKESESSTSSSVGGTPPKGVRRSKSLVEITSTHYNEIKRSKSEICGNQTAPCKNPDFAYKEGSIISTNMDRFANKPNLRCTVSKSHGTSLDGYMEHKFASRLFLTKDYKGHAMSSYQKRKLYDQSMRERMKRRWNGKLDLEPQIFEVRYLSMMNQTNNLMDRGIFEPFERPVVSLNIENILEQGVCNKTEKKPSPRKKPSGETTDSLNVKEPNLIFDSSYLHEDIKTNYLHNTNLTKDDSQLMTEILFKGDRHVHQENLLRFCKMFFNINDILDEQLLQNTSCNCKTFSEACSACNNFLTVMDTLCSALDKYRDSRINLNQSNMKDPKNNSKEPSKIFENPEANGKEECMQSKKFQQENPQVEEIYCSSLNENSSDSLCATFERVSLETVEDSAVVTQLVSCPAVTVDTDSFEFLYKDESSADDVTSDDSILANFTTQFDHMFNADTNQYNVQASSFPRKDPESVPDSIESGYGSTGSKTFFERPNIAALLQHPISSRKIDTKNSEKSGVFKEMTKSCQLYAKKVRETSEMKFQGNDGDYQEFSLQILLGKNSIFEKNKNASVKTKDNFISDMTSYDRCYLEIEQIRPDSVHNDEESPETCNPGSNFECSSKESRTSYSQNGCKLILSNECLNIESITYLGPEMFAYEYDGPISKKNESFECSEAGAEENISFLTLNMSTDSNNPLLSNSDSATKNFFTALVKIYEKEMEICNKLYKDADFEKALLATVEERRSHEKKTKKSKLYRFFSKKLPDNIKKHPNDHENQIKLDKKISSKLQILASNARKCFTMLAEAVKANENIDNEIKICGLLRLLERIENGDYQMIQNEENVNLEQEIRSQITEAFVNVHELCQKESKKCKRRVTDKEVGLIKSFVAKYRIGLLSKTDIIASYIGRGTIQTEEQLKAAVTFLIRSPFQQVNVKDFELYCNFPASKK